MVDTCTAKERLSPEKLRALLSQEGPLSHLLSSFEVREEQQAMLSHVAQAYNDNQIALIEAGTGTGKSMAYLLPALLWAVQENERTVISTHTIHLQEQLLHKDIPLALQVLGVEAKAVLVKGMGNYLCLRKLDEAIEEMRLFPPEEGEEIEKIASWHRSSSVGTKSELPFVPSHRSWEKVAAESDTCTHVRCPHYKECPFFEERKHAQDAQLLVVNHSLLFADLSLRRETKEEGELSILPDYQRVIIDEAHHMEEVATQHFASHVHRLGMLKQMGKIAADKRGKLTILGDLLFKGGGDKLKLFASLTRRLTLDVPAQKRQLLDKLAEFFEVLELFLQQSCSDDPQEKECKLRIVSAHHALPFWKEEVVPRAATVLEECTRFIQSVSSLGEEIKTSCEEEKQEKSSTLFLELRAYLKRLQKMQEVFRDFIHLPLASEEVRWVETKPVKGLIDMRLTSAMLEIAPLLVEALFAPFPTVVLCSATLAIGHEFAYVRQRWGLDLPELAHKKMSEKIYPSPFNYREQTLLVIPKDIPSPQSPGFLAEVIERIWEAVQASQGNAFVLFTSYGMLRLCAEALKERFVTQRFTLFMQGKSNRRSLLEKFAETPRSILFGTDSFWEGVDVVGESLRLVLIVKLPFKVPTEPIIQARTEAIKEKGGNPFREHSLPQAIVKFKQGFGRLIRNRCDRGVVVCLDSRLLTKSYGKLFLDTLPPCTLASVSTEEFSGCLKKFYTYLKVGGKAPA